MLKLIHAPRSRSSRVLWLLEELGADYAIQYVDIPRMDGSGAYDPANPHPLGQAPAIENHGAVITETVVIFQYLCDLFPQAGMAPPIGERAAYASWLGLYNAVLEPVITARFRRPEGGTPQQKKAYQTLCDTWRSTLEQGDYLLGERFSAIDILFASLLTYFRASMPDDAIYDQWLARVTARPALARALEKDALPA